MAGLHERPVGIFSVKDERELIIKLYAAGCEASMLNCMTILVMRPAAEEYIIVLDDFRLVSLEWRDELKKLQDHGIPHARVILMITTPADAILRQQALKDAREASNMNLGGVYFRSEPVEKLAALIVKIKKSTPLPVQDQKNVVILTTDVSGYESFLRILAKGDYKITRIAQVSSDLDHKAVYVVDDLLQSTGFAWHSVDALIAKGIPPDRIIVASSWIRDQKVMATKRGVGFHWYGDSKTLRSVIDAIPPVAAAPE